MLHFVLLSFLISEIMCWIGIFISFQMIPILPVSVQKVSPKKKLLSPKKNPRQVPTQSILIKKIKNDETPRQSCRILFSCVIHKFYLPFSLSPFYVCRLLLFSFFFIFNRYSSYGSFGMYICVIVTCPFYYFPLRISI